MELQLLLGPLETPLLSSLLFLLFSSPLFFSLFLLFINGFKGIK